MTEPCLLLTREDASQRSLVERVPDLVIKSLTVNCVVVSLIHLSLLAILSILCLMLCKDYKPPLFSVDFMAYFGFSGRASPVLQAIWRFPVVANRQHV